MDSASQIPFKWTYTTWHSDEVVPLKANRFLTVQRGVSKEATSEGMARHAEASYLACRILMISSTVVHGEALYFVAQTLEKNMKAILLSRGVKKIPCRNGKLKALRQVHSLGDLALATGEFHREFHDPEFLKMCEQLDPFEIAGRYPDHDLQFCRFPLELLTFLDGFVARCRELLGKPDPAQDPIAALLSQRCNGNRVMEAAIMAVRDSNTHFR